MSGAPIARAVAALTGDGPPRVWSLIVTFFGDLAQGPGAEVPGPVLSRVMGAADIRPEAMRVALHRLKRDGWIDSAKRGRTVDYSLTARGRAESAAASPRIYGRAEPAPWRLFNAAQGEAAALDPLLAGGSHVALAPGLVAGPMPGGAVPEGIFVSQPGAVPGWAQRAVCPEALVAAAAALVQTLEEVARDVEAPGPLERAVLRVLIVHRWRRIVLRLPDAPEAFLPEDWRALGCAARVAEVLDALPRPEIAEIGGG
ncbi:PaaX family transcriptional regulator C-terminal domain-containing protein [Ovoidimarina sediminis]|uniref:PaaX family transcriptional regulator C-terminal domain-containing protein n=1 Tax=Ovoidimarina sediminis TaxID=3079856 RepID=UPI002911DE72|nr:PaaX family transcriptional regulator C-terminal domain-containing protein [Rhodophyticola sp. MJ-SS7]MDU8943118.1 PaaX family transcriptional regulator C-terminal domain-containing protein [Rhodophyticola sp. MJ-SS7]